MADEISALIERKEAFEIRLGFTKLEMMPLKMLLKQYTISIKDINQKIEALTKDSDQNVDESVLSALKKKKVELLLFSYNTFQKLCPFLETASSLISKMEGLDRCIERSKQTVKTVVNGTCTSWSSWV